MACRARLQQVQGVSDFVIGAVRALAVLGKGNQVSVTASVGSRFLQIAGQPLAEPVACGGPFVMNTRTEVLQAFKDLQNNKF